MNMNRLIIAVLCAGVFGCSQQTKPPPDDVEDQRVVAYRKVMATLRGKVVQLDSEPMTLEEALELVRTESGGNICVNWASIEAMGIERSEQLDLEFESVTLADLLDAILQKLGEDYGDLGYELTETVVIAARADLPPRSIIIETTDYNDLTAARQEKYRISPTLDASSESGIYIPKNLDECMVELSRALHPDFLEEIKSGSEADMILHHFGLGLWIRNNWVFCSESRLYKYYFVELGVTDPDSVSGIILDSFWRHLNNRPVKLDEQIARSRAALAQESQQEQVEEESAEELDFDLDDDDEDWVEAEVDESTTMPDEPAEP